MKFHHTDYSKVLSNQRGLWHNRPIPSEANFSLNGNLHELERLAAEVDQFGAVCALSEDTRFALNLILEELFTNAVQHGGCAAMEDAARVRLRCEPGAVRVEFSDRGAPFDPASVDPPDLSVSLADRRIGGLGLHFVRQMARDLEYHRSEGWNRITLRVPATVVQEEA